MTGWAKLIGRTGMRGVLARWIADAESCVDPYWLMAEVMGFAAFAKPARLREHKLPVLVEKAVGKDDRFVLEAHSRSDLSKLIERIGSKKLRRFQLASPRTAGINEAPPTKQNGQIGKQASESPSNTPCAMHFGVIDDGFPFAHSNLLTKDGQPLISSIWDQTDGAAARKNWESLGLGNGDFGGLLTRDAIEKVLKDCSGSQGLDEARVYAETEYRVNQPGVPHGCGVTHMLVGRSVRLPDGSRAESTLTCDDVHCVQLPSDGTLEDTAGGWLGYYALAGIRHIIRRIQQEENGGPWRSLINLSYGSIAGPHDGTSMFEQAIDTICTRYGDTRTGKVDIVVAAGNTRGKRIHAQRTIGPGHPGSFRFFTPPDNPRESYLELWIPKMKDGLLAGVAITVTSPTGAQITAHAGEAHLLKLEPGRAPCAGIAFSHRVSQGTKGTMFLLLVRPTQTTARTDRAPSGVWELSVTANCKIDIHGWVERNDMVVHHRRNQQACFVEDPDCPQHVNDDRTFSSAAGGKRAIVVGAVRHNDGTIANYCGVDLRVAATKPNWFAASDTSPAMPGVLVSGFYSGTTTRMSGTSVAAPRVARLLATRNTPPTSRQYQQPPLPDPTGTLPPTLEYPNARTLS